MKIKIEVFASEKETRVILDNILKRANSFTYSEEDKIGLRVIEADINERISFDWEFDSEMYSNCLTYKISIEGQKNDLVQVEGANITEVLSIAFKDKDEASKNSLINEILENYWRNIKEG